MTRQPRRLTAVRISDDGIALAEKLAKKTGALRSEALRVLFALGAEQQAEAERRLRKVVAEVNAARAAKGRPPRRPE